MRIRELDERDGSWEDHAPVFWAYLFRGAEESGSWTTPREVSLHARMRQLRDD